MENITETFGKKLKSLRKQNGYTQEELAKVLNTTRSCISNYELGNRQPDNETIRAFADFFDVSIDYLMGRSTISLSVQNAECLQDMQKIKKIINNITEVDITFLPLKAKCIILEFYDYLAGKDISNKN